jgi:hypothetical protein
MRNEDLEQFEKRAALAEQQIEELALRVAILGGGSTTLASAMPRGAQTSKAPGTSLTIRFPEHNPPLMVLVVSQFVEARATPAALDQVELELR